VSIRRPALRYFGGKWRLAPWIISHFPAHVCYVEPFAGAASVMLRKAPSCFEYYNDADGRVVNFFRQLRDHESELERLIRLTPFSREEFRLSGEVSSDPLEDARRFYVRMWQGRGGHEASTGWRYQRRPASNKSALRVFADAGHLAAIVDRLREVAIENDDAFAVIRRYDAPETLFYVDPPYLQETRSKTIGCYREEFKTPEEHRLLLTLLDEVVGYVVLSHPHCELYESCLKDWSPRAKEHLSQQGQRYEETLWLNKRCAEAQKQIELFATRRQ